MSMNYDDDWNDDDREFRSGSLKGEKKRCRCTSKTIIISVIVGVVVVAAAIGGYFIYKKVKEAKPLVNPKTRIEMYISVTESILAGCSGNHYYCKPNRYDLIRIIGKEFPINDYKGKMEILIDNKKERKVENFKDFSKKKGKVKVNINFLDEQLKKDDLRFLFQGITYALSIKFEAVNTAKMKSMEGFFKDCKLVTSIDLSGFNTTNVENMTSMFEGCVYLKTLDLSKFVTSKVVKMNSMFKGCDNLDLNNTISHFDTRKVKTFNFMFTNCAELGDLDLTGWTFTLTKAFDFMFSKAKGTVTITNSDKEYLEGYYSNIFQDVDVKVSTAPKKTDIVKEKEPEKEPIS